MENRQTFRDAMYIFFSKVCEKLERKMGLTRVQLCGRRLKETVVLSIFVHHCVEGNESFGCTFSWCVLISPHSTEVEK